MPSAPPLPAQTRGRRAWGEAPGAQAGQPPAARAAEYADDRADPAPLHGHPPARGRRLDHQCDRPAPEPGPQDGPSLPRHRPRRAPRLRPSPASDGGAGAVQGLSQCPVPQHIRAGQRHPTLPGDPRTRLPGKPRCGPPAPRRSAGGHRRTRPGGHPQPPQDHLVDHAAPRDPHREPGGTTASSPARLPRHRPGLRPRPHLLRPRPPQARTPAHAVDPPGRTRRPQTHERLRWLPPPRPRRRHRRTHPALELGRRRRPREPGQNTQESNVWPGLLRTRILTRP